MTNRKRLFEGLKRAFTGKGLLITIPVGCLGFCIFSFALILIVGSIIPPTFDLKERESYSWDAQSPTEVVKFECAGVSEVTINEQSIPKESVDAICGDDGYTLELNDGENLFNLIAKSADGKSAEKTLTITFDKVAYDENIANQERLEQERIAQEKAEEERKQKEAEENARQEIEQFKQDYQSYKTDYINKAYTNSSDMITLVSNGTDLYQTRQTAKNYRDYFQSNCYKNTESHFRNIPDKYSEDIKQINSNFSDYCMYNEFLASRVIDYTEASSVSEQYDHLDQITYYQGLVADLKFTIDLHIVSIDGNI